MSDLSDSSALNQPQTPPPPTKVSAPAAAIQRASVRSIHYTLSYLAQNTERGPRGAIVLLHDLPGGAFVWERVMPALAGTGRAVYAFDLLGFGKSDQPWPADTSIWGHADILSYAFRTQGLTEMTLVGFGLGGGVAQTLATRLYRDGVARLALINTYAYEYAFAPDWPFPEMAKHQDPELAHHMSAAEEQTELRQTIPAGAVNRLSDERLGAYLDAWKSDVGKNVIMQQVRNMSPLYMNSVASDVVALDQPMLVVWGEKDTVTPVALGQRIASEARQARLEVVAGAGHLILDDAPDRVGALLASFAS